MTVYFDNEEILGTDIDEILISSKTGVIFIQLKNGKRLIEHYATKDELLDRTSVIMVSMK